MTTIKSYVSGEESIVMQISIVFGPNFIREGVAKVSEGDKLLRGAPAVPCGRQPVSFPFYLHPP